MWTSTSEADGVVGAVVVVVVVVVVGVDLVGNEDEVEVS